jgi:hypothetical protein
VNALTLGTEIQSGVGEHGGNPLTHVRFFIAMCFLGGLGGFIGSVIGAAFGQQALFVGGFVGGIAVALFSARVAVWRRWIARHQYWPTAIGAALGFVAAAMVAVNTLSSPIGPVVSTLLTGTGAFIGRRLSR